MKTQNLLIVFYRNPELGKVKTRLASTMGEERAFSIYQRLVNHTKDEVTKVKAKVIVYYSERIENNDIWDQSLFNKAVKHGDTLGDKMLKAFENGFSEGYESVCIIGTDSIELTSNTIDEAFELLKSHEVVIGPAKDGGYYLLGMNKLVPDLFINKKWSSATVAQDTINDLNKLGIKFRELISLSDVDYEHDLPDGWRE